MKILITGGAGFIGSSLCHYLIHKGFQIVCLDNFDDFYAETIKCKNIAELLPNPNFDLIRGDIRDTLLLNKIFSKHNIDLVVHLAAKAGVRNSLVEPEAYMEVNINGTIRLLEAMKRFKVKNIIFSSSSSVYGNKNNIFSEDDKTDMPISPYAISKKTGELLTYNYYKNDAFKVINLRLFSIYGSRQRPDLAIYKFFKSLNNNLPIEIYGDGNQLRDFTYIDDLIEAIYQSITYCVNCTDSLYEIINIGSNNPISINSLLNLMKSIEGKEMKVKYLTTINGDAYATHANIAKAQKLLNFVPKTTLMEGLILFNTWFTSNVNIS